MCCPMDPPTVEAWMDHSEHAGAACTFVDGMCTGCKIGEDTCYACEGIGYHTATCPESDENYDGSNG